MNSGLLDLPEPVIVPLPPQQSEEDRIDQLLQTTSASRLGTWQKCRLLFYFRYVLKIKKPATPALHVGSVVHLVLQAWNKARWRNEPFPNARKLFEEHWASLQPESQELSAIDKESAWAVLEAYWRETPILPEEKPLGVEVPVEADLSRMQLPTLIGVIDLVRSGGVIVDFKVTGKTPDPDQLLQLHGTQLACYSLLYREATGKKEAGLELHHLIRTKTPKVLVTQIPPVEKSQRERLFRVMQSYVSGLERRDFIPSPGIQCAGCEFASECRGWDGTAKESHGLLCN
jgi:putative RecB family exonuclease